VAARVHPDLLDPAWLWEVPAGLPRPGAHLARIALEQRSDLIASVAAWLATRPDVLLEVDPDDLLTPLVLGSAEKPATVLRPFTPYVGERTQVACAEWHLEHDQATEALTLASTIRTLSPWRLRATALTALAQIQRRRLSEARTTIATMDPHPLRDVAALRLAEQDPTFLDAEALAAIAGRAPVEDTAMVLTALRILASRKDLAGTRRLAAAAIEVHGQHPELGPVLQRLLSRR
jgi:hypothetical protein